MKQTNNAIKFLMAQYRAIFRNANLKMFLAAATAAAAMAAGSAQAGNLEQAGWAALSGDKTVKTGGDFDAIALTANADQAHENTNKFTLTIEEGAAHAITGHTDNKGGFTAKSGSLVIAGKAGVDATKLEIGKTSGAAVTLDSVDVSKGTLALTKGSLKANSITLGETSKLTMADGAVSASTILLKSGSTAEVTKGTLGAKGNTITVEKDATITGKGGKADEAKLAGTVNVNGGTITVGAEKLTIDGSLTVSSGKFSTTAAGGIAKVTGEAHFNSEKSYSNSGTIVLGGTSTFADGSVDTAATGGKLHLDGTATMSSSTLKDLLGGAEIASDTNKNGVIKLNDGKELDLGVATIVGASDGVVSAKFKKQGTGTLTIDVGDAKFDGADVLTGQDGVTLLSKNLSVGKGTAASVTFKSGGVSVSESLSVPSGKSLILDSGNALTLDGVTKNGTISAQSVTVGSANAEASLTVKNGEWKLPDLTLTSGAASVEEGAGLTVDGKLTFTANGSLTVTNGWVSLLGEKGTIAAKDAKNDGITLTGGTLKVDGDDILKANKLDADKLKKEALKGDASSRLEITLGEGVKLTGDEFSALKKELASFHGIYKVSVDTGIDPTGDVTLDQIKKFPQLETDAFNKSTLTLKNTEAIDQNYSVGNILMTEGGDLSLADGGAFTLNTPKDGLFVGKKTDTGVVAANVKFEGTTANSNSLTLAGKGDIGAITATATSKGKLVVGLAGETPVSGDVTVVSGGIGGTGAVLGEVALNDGSSLTVKSGDIFADNLALGAGTSLDVKGNVTVDTAAVKGADINVKNFAIKQTTSALADDAVFSIDAGTMRVTEKLALGQNNLVTVGTAPTLDVDGTELDQGSSAQVFAGTLELKTGSVLFVDPGFKSLPSFVVGQTITDGTPGNLAGSIAIGKNSAVGIGFTEEDFNKVMSKHLVDGKFVAKDGYANAIVIGTPITIAASQYINVDKNLNKASGDGNSVHLGEGAALVVTKDALTSANGAIKFGASNGTVKADLGSTVVLEGGVTLADKDLILFSGTGMTINSQATIAAAGGLIKGSLDSTGKLALEADNEKLGAIRSVVSSPVVDMLVDYRDGDFASNSGTGLSFIETMLNKDNFVAIDAAAHAATYAGAQQAAVAAVGTMAEAVGGRVGSMGVEAATIDATGSQLTGGVWISPMYKSVDADGFNAQGVSYGADIDLAGVAFGADTVDGNSRYGVVFNIGSGDAEGKGNGNGLKDDFDYYGIGLYSVRASNNFAVVADASYNVISHDVEGLGAKGSAETIALTAGLTGQYTMSSPMVDVTPHLGARFIRLDTDSYDLVKGGDVLATTDFDVQNVFSVPLGVTLSKAFEMGGWSLAPSADLSITFNTGDTDVQSNTYFTGTKNYGFTTEVLDEVTYGVAVGLGAQYGAFGTQIGLNYTGSSNTDSFGVNAQARYMF